MGGSFVCVLLNSLCQAVFFFDDPSMIFVEHIVTIISRFFPHDNAELPIGNTTFRETSRNDLRHIVVTTVARRLNVGKNAKAIAAAIDIDGHIPCTITRLGSSIAQQEIKIVLLAKRIGVVMNKVIKAEIVMGYG